MKQKIQRILERLSDSVGLVDISGRVTSSGCYVDVAWDSKTSRYMLTFDQKGDLIKGEIYHAGSSYPLPLEIGDSRSYSRDWVELTQPGIKLTGR